MSIGLLAKKVGMTQAFNEHGLVAAVTVLKAGPCTVTQVKTAEKDGYQAVQVGFDPVAKESRLTKSLLGHFKKAGTVGFRYLREFRTGNGDQFATGQQLTVELFKEGELIDVTGISIGRGFQGGMKRWNWRGGPATHGSTSKRRPGSIGSTTTPGRVFRGHHLPGHMGDERVTIQNLRIMKVDAQEHLLLIEGAVPGPDRRLVIVRKSVKKPGVIKAATSLHELVGDEEDDKKKPAKKK
jgi:large subunit ribosomal protein L3